MISRISKIIFGLIVFLFHTYYVIAQSGCNDMKEKCDGYGEPYKYSGQSKSGTFELGQTSAFKMSTFSGFEYSVSLCADKQLKGIFFRLREDTKDGAILYDGQSEGDEMNWKQFYIEDSKTLYVEVVVPEAEEAVEELEYSETIGCVAVIIEYFKVGKKGFD